MAEIDKLQKTPEILAKYQGVENTLVRSVKQDPKDTIKIEVGDSKQPDFKPQFKISRWDNEVNFSMRAEEDPTATVEYRGEKVIYKAKDFEVHQFDVPTAGEDGGFEFEWVLAKKPETNIFRSSINFKGLRFARQRPIDPKTPGYDPLLDNVSGSYAVYHDSRSGNYLDKHYKTGKAFHIYRPKAIDANGDWVWCDLNISLLNAELTVTVPQDFLEKAAYPVRVDPTFGLTSIGSHNSSGTNDLGVTNVSNWRAQRLIPPASGTVQSITAYIRGGFSGSTGMKGVISTGNPNDATLPLITDGVTGTPGSILTGTQSWVTASFGTDPTVVGGDSYFVGIMASKDGFYVSWDDDYTEDSIHTSDTGNNYTTPVDPTPPSYQTGIKASIYFTYTYTSTTATMSTVGVSEVGETTARGYGSVTSDGGALITEKGIVWATTSNPTTANNKAVSSDVTDDYDALLTGLPASTTIHYRAYAINIHGTSYGSDQTFVTTAAESFDGDLAAKASTGFDGELDGGGGTLATDERDAEVTGRYAPVEDLIDNFDDNSIGAQWTTYLNFATVTETNQQIEIAVTPNTNGAEGDLYTVNNMSLTGSGVSVNVKQLASPDVDTLFIVQAAPGDRLMWLIAGTTIAAYVQDNYGTITSNSVGSISVGANLYLRIRESGGTIYFDYSTDAGQNWTNLHSDAVADVPWDIDNVDVVLAIYEYSASGATTQTTSIFDNVNVIPVAGATVTDERDAEVTGAAAASDERDAEVTGSATANAERDAETTGSAAASAERDAEVTGSASATAERDAEVTGADTANAERDAEVTGSQTASDERDAEVSGQDTANSSRPAETTGSLTADAERDAEVSGALGSTDERDAEVSGIDTAAAERDAEVVGSLDIADVRDAEVTGALGSTDTRDAETHGTADATDDRDAEVTGSLLTTNERDAEVTGALGATAERDAEVRGSLVTADDRDAQTTGSESAAAERDAEVTGRVISTDDRDAETHGTATTADVRDAEVTGSQTDQSERDAEVLGSAVATDDRDAQVHGQDTTAAEREAELTGSESATDDREAEVTGGLRVSSERGAEVTGDSDNPYRPAPSPYSRKPKPYTAQASSPFTKKTSPYTRANSPLTRARSIR